LRSKYKYKVNTYNIIIIDEQINVAFSPKTTRTRNAPKTTCSV